MKLAYIIFFLLFSFQYAYSATENDSSLNAKIISTYDEAVNMIKNKKNQKQAEEKLVKVVRALELQKPINPHNIGSAYFYLWECNKKSEYAQKAKQYLLQALLYKEAREYYSTKDPSTYCLLGELCLFLKEYKASIGYFCKFLQIVKELKLNTNFSRVYRDVAIAYSKDKNYKNAIIYIKKSLEEFPDSKDLHQQINRIGLSLFHISFLIQDNKKREAQPQLNQLRIQLSKLPQDNVTVKKIFKQCDVFQKDISN